MRRASAADGGGDGFAPGAGLAAGVHPAEEVVDGLAGVRRGEGVEVGAGGVGGEVAGVRDAGGGGADDAPEFATADAVGLGAVGGSLVAEGDGVLEALGGVDLGDGAGGGNGGGCAGGLADGQAGGDALGVGDIGISLDFGDHGADVIDEGLLFFVEGGECGVVGVFRGWKRAISGVVGGPEGVGLKDVGRSEAEVGGVGRQIGAKGVEPLEAGVPFAWDEISHLDCVSLV